MTELKTQDRDEAFRLWLEVLRDPKSEKEKGRLENPDNPNARCCLGHACHALGAERRVVQHPTSAMPASHDVRVEYGGAGEHGEGGQYSVLPADVARVLKLTYEGSFKWDALPADDALRYTVGAPFGLDSLASLNDKTNISPAELADVIEALWKNRGFKTYYDYEEIGEV